MINYSPKIVTDGLVLCIDPSQNSSFPVSDLPVKGNLALWLDASDDSTFSYSSGTSVSLWKDKSGNNYSAVQATVANQPSRSTTQNSKKTLNFDGTNDTLVVSNFIGNSEMSIFVVSNCGNTLFIEHSVNVNTNNGFYLYGAGGGMFAINRNSVITYNALTDWLTGGYSIATGTNSIGTDLLTFKNGTQQSPSSSNLVSISASNTTASLYIGSRAASGIWTSGPIAEILIYNRKVSNAERNSIHTYLGLKWGIVNTDKTILDLSGLSNNGTLSTDAVLNQNQQKTIQFRDNSGSGSYINFGNINLNLTSLTVDYWFKLTSDPNIDGNNTYRYMCIKDSNFFNFLEENRVINFTVYKGGSQYRRVGDYNGTGIFGHGVVAGQDFGTAFSIDVWYNVVFVYDNSNGYGYYYLNGVLLNSGIMRLASNPYTAITAGNIDNTTSAGTFSGLDSGATPFFFPGRLGPLKIYNRNLSSAEIASNYSAFKSKYLSTIIESGLVLNLDADDPSSYAGSGTTWIDTSGSNANFTLDSSGITWNSNGYFTLNDGGATRSSSITSSTTCTVVLFIKTNDAQALTFKGNNNNNYYIAAYYSGQGFYSGTAGTPTYWIDLNSVSNPWPTYLDNKWHMWEIKNVDLSTWTVFEFNKYAGFTFANSAVAKIMIYNKNLSADESQTNYNSFLERVSRLNNPVNQD
jgi:hypothetical protein